jgi:hypothetical protein
VRTTNAREIKDKATEHWHEHKEIYIVAIMCFGAGVLAGITSSLMRSNIPRGGMGEDVARGGTINTASLIFRNQGTVNVTTVLDREGRGHPGWPCRNLETKKVFFSQREAALAFDIPEGLLSGHLKGKFPDVDGLHFERVNLVETKPASQEKQGV